MAHAVVTIKASDGNCPAHVFTAVDGAKAPAIVFFMDAGGIRHAVLDMGQRLADAGFLVLLPDLFYRYGAYGPFDPMEVLGGDFKAILGPLMATTGNATAASDVNAFLAYLDSRPDVVGSKVGAVGFCMGGGMAITTAAARPDRFAAVASFHAGNLATDASDSPHTYAADLQAELYVAAAENDASYPPEMAFRFEQALDDAQVAYIAETYPAAHGWMKPDFPSFEIEAAERGWNEMLKFFSRILKTP